VLDSCICKGVTGIGVLKWKMKEELYSEDEKKWRRNEMLKRESCC